MFIKYIKNFLRREPGRLSYIEDAWCLKVKLNNFFLEVMVNVKQSHYRPGQTLRVPGG
jgi:hypothetical protein